ncbi:DUF2073 domain-containing protein [Candidatus Pacearchaeota archaeon]|nr:DUF2073 domain-containing protein [Candidatus Pacearchaeota archaeon]
MVKKKKKVFGKFKKGKDNLTIHFMPYSEIANEDAIGRIKKIMGLVLKNKIIILQGKLDADEEVRLIENSMTLIGNIKGFAGIEIASLSGENENRGLFEGVRRNIAKILVGEQDAITVIGPASVVKEITKDPKKIELMLQRK